MSCPQKMSWFLEDRKFFSQEEQGRLKGYLSRHLFGLKRGRWMDWFVIELALETGLRVGEMSALLHSDFRTDSTTPGVLVCCGKGGKPRFVRVRQELCHKAQKFFAWKQETGQSTGPEAPLFWSPRTKKGMTVRGLQKIFERVSHAAGIEGHSIHHCRHTYATELLRASKGNLRLVQKQLGHAKITTTQVYADVVDEDIQEAVDQLYKLKHK